MHRPPDVASSARPFPHLYTEVSELNNGCRCKDEFDRS